ncbi:MAG: hypothetical protein Q9170_007696 [Blastenia crenularia]
MSAHQSNSQHPLSLADFDLSDTTPTVQQLSNLHKLIDRECVNRSSHHGTPDPDLAAGNIIQVTVYLSSQLLQWLGADSDLFRETQLRALVAAFALLLHSEVTELAPPRYDELRKNIAGRFYDVVNVPTSSLDSRIRKANALYLIRLVAQYFSLIKRAGPVTDALVMPILGLVLVGASVATGQYTGLRSVFHIADEIIGLIPGREAQHLNLPAVQEITRRATTLLKENSAMVEDDENLEALEAATADVKLVQELLNSNIQEIPSRRKDSWNWPLARLRQGPPSMNKWYFFYGLLDCAAQLARRLPSDQISTNLLKTFARIMEESEFEELRWKITEIFLFCSRTGNRFLTSLPKPLGTGPPSLTSKVDVEALTRLLEESTVNSAGAGMLVPDPHTADSASVMHTDQQAQIKEMDPETYMAGDQARWEQDGGPQVTQLLPNKSIFREGFAHAGLSTDCKMIFFYNTAKVCVYPLNASNPIAPNQKWPLKWKFGKKNPVVDVSLSNTVLAISTRQRLELHYVKDFSASSETPRTIPHGEWDPCGLATFEQPSEALVAIGYRRETRISREGRVLIYRSILNHGRIEKEETSQRYQVLKRDLPKSLQFDKEGEKLTCVTEISNSVLVWHIGDSDPFEITTQHHMPVRNGLPTLKRKEMSDQANICSKETDSDGVTSAVIYKSSSERYFVICSTSASTERYRSGGEWSFSSPIATTNEQVPRNTVHDFIALKNHRQLVASAVSEVANIYAVLEKSGKILVLQLTSHEAGGIHTSDTAPVTLRPSLCNLQSSRASPTCLRFDPSGKKLYGIDAEGKLLTVTFKPEG